MARYYYKDGIKIDVEKVGLENMQNVVEAISVNENIVTITEEELEVEKSDSFLKGIGWGVLGTGLAVYATAKLARKDLDRQSKINEEKFINYTKMIKRNNE